VRPPERGSGRLHVAGLHAGANVGGADRRVALGEQPDPVRGEAERASQLGERRDVAGRLVTEPEVLAHDHRRRVQPRHQYLVRELGRRHLGELAGERQRAKHIDPELLDEFGAPHERGQHRRMRARSHHLRGMGHEREQHAGQTLLAGRLDRLADDHGVAAVHPVEYPDRYHTTSPVRRGVVEAMPALHVWKA
jgi:hypothetical protein